MTATPGEIILCHMNRPESGVRDGLKAALPRLRDKGARFVRLPEALGAE
jgi:peptidoglycan/xylan/chitin deacetylase (PgdA/CDA1 family)